MDKYSLLMHGIKFESFAKFIFEWKKNIYVWVCLFAIYVLYLCIEEDLSSGNFLDHDEGTKDSKTWFVYCTEWSFICTNPCKKMNF